MSHLPCKMSGFCGLWRGIAFAPAPYLASVYTAGSSSGSKTPGLSHVQRKLAIAYDAPVNLKEWPSPNSERRTVRVWSTPARWRTASGSGWQSLSNR
jgi:hypothetical protein